MIYTFSSRTFLFRDILVLVARSDWVEAELWNPLSNHLATPPHLRHCTSCGLPACKPPAASISLLVGIFAQEEGVSGKPLRRVV